MLVILFSIITIGVSSIAKATNELKSSATLESWISALIDHGISDDVYKMALHNFEQKTKESGLSHYYAAPLDYSINYNKMDLNNSIGITMNYYLVDGENRIPSKKKLMYDLEELYVQLVFEFRRVLRNYMGLALQIHRNSEQTRLIKDSMTVLESQGISNIYYKELLLDLEVLLLENRQLEFSALNMTNGYQELLFFIDSVQWFEPIDYDIYDHTIRESPWKCLNYSLDHISILNKKINDQESNGNISIIAQGRMDFSSQGNSTYTISLLFRSNSSNQYFRSSTSANISREDVKLSYGLSSQKTLPYVLMDREAKPSDSLDQTMINLDLLMEQYGILQKRIQLYEDYWMLDPKIFNAGQLESWLASSIELLRSQVALKQLQFEILLMQGRFDELLPLDYIRNISLYE